MTGHVVSVVYVVNVLLSMLVTLGWILVLFHPGPHRGSKPSAPRCKPWAAAPPARARKASVDLNMMSIRYAAVFSSSRNRTENESDAQDRSERVLAVYENDFENDTSGQGRKRRGAGDKHTATGRLHRFDAR